MARRLWHVSPSLNRASIAEHGLDWRRMTITTGIATGPDHGAPVRPELEAVFLCESLDDVEFFVGFGHHPYVDVWEVDPRGLATEPGPDGWAMSRAAIAPERIRLLPSGRLAAQADEGRFVAREDDRDGALAAQTRALLERIGVVVGYP